MKSIFSRKQNPLPNLCAWTLCFLAAAATDVSACAVCFGKDSGDPAIKGIQYGIFAMLAIVFFIFGCIIKFAINFKNRANAAQ